VLNDLACGCRVWVYPIPPLFSRFRMFMRMENEHVCKKSNAKTASKNLQNLENKEVTLRPRSPWHDVIRLPHEAKRGRLPMGGGGRRTTLIHTYPLDTPRPIPVTFL
jgi:hypothetical protein